MSVDVKKLREFAVGQIAHGFLDVVCQPAQEVIDLLDRLETAEKERDALRESMERQGRAAVSGMNAAKQNAAEMERNAIRLHAESSPAALASERAANAILTEEADALRKDAERYRWLKECKGNSVVIVEIMGMGDDDQQVLTDGCADAAIDAEMLLDAGAETTSEPAPHGVVAGVQGGAGMAQEGGK